MITVRIVVICGRLGGVHRRVATRVLEAFSVLIWLMGSRVYIKTHKVCTKSLHFTERKFHRN